VEEARRISAVPGHSEHQLGLGMDISTMELEGELSSAFLSSPEGMWVQNNAHRFGFIISYPEGREEDTGFIFEPWHVRYVGVEPATTMFETGQILEEYLWYNHRGGN
jgi:LAS superfamily LD-carboxypeptidase LdcB